jgi:alcohol dehydrogenase class IV
MTINLICPISLIYPPRIEFGSGTAQVTGQWIRAKGFTRILVVASAFHAARVDQLGLDRSVTVFAEVKPEPDVANLEALLGVAEAADAQVVVGFGGGSSMDLAKLAAVLSRSGQSIADIVGVEKVTGKRAALVQVPTTSGTGSEAGIRALVTDLQTRNKLAVQSTHMLADLAVIDPDLTLSVPPALTAATGVDALAHCVECFTNRKAHPTIDLYALEGIRLVGRWLPRAIADGTNREARAGLSFSGTIRGLLSRSGQYNRRSCDCLSTGDPPSCGAWRGRRLDLPACAGLQHTSRTGTHRRRADRIGAADSLGTPNGVRCRASLVHRSRLQDAALGLWHTGR